MRTLVIYFSNTGNTQKVAKTLAGRLGADLAEVTCGTYLRWYGPLAVAWDIFTRHIPKVDVLVPVGAHYDVVVLGGPVWAAHAAPPIMALADHPVLNATHRRCGWVLRRGSPDLMEQQGCEDSVALQMQRTDIGDYLGLTFETVSRVFRVLKESGLINLPTPDRVKVISKEGLERFCAV